MVGLGLYDDAVDESAAVAAVAVDLESGDDDDEDDCDVELVFSVRFVDVESSLDSVWGDGD